MKQKEQIKNAALSVFIEKGYSGASIAEIALKAEINPATIYRFFRSKEELFQSLQRPDLNFPDTQEQQMRQRIIRSALQVFGQKGYSTATMDEIAEAACLTKPAVYFYFPSKEKLFYEVLENPAGFKLIETSLKDFLSEDSMDLESGLIHLAKTYLSLFQNFESMALLKIVLSEGIHNKEIATRFTQRIIERGTEAVAVYLNQFCTLDAEDLHIRIQNLFGMLFSWGFINVLLPQKLEIQPAEVELAATAMVKQFIYGIQTSIKSQQNQEKSL